MNYNKYCIELLAEMIAIRSFSQREEQMAKYVYNVLGNIGLDVQLQHIQGESFNVVANITNEIEQKSKIILGGHIDTVQPGYGWETDPFNMYEDDNHIYGLGSCDMKGGLAAQITVIKKLIDEGRITHSDIAFIGLADEERHSLGANSFIREFSNFVQEGVVIFAEPHFDHIVIGATGKLLLDLTVYGSRGHAATPESGVNAIDCMNDFLSNVRRKYEPLYFNKDIGSFNVLSIRGGKEEYSLEIPDSCFAIMNKQISVGENVDGFIKGLDDLYIEKVNKGTLLMKKSPPYYPAYLVNKDNQYLKGLVNVMTDYNSVEPELIINNSVSDGNLITTEIGIPTLLWGPKGNNYHRSNEYVDKSSLFSYIEMLEKYLLHSINY